MLKEIDFTKDVIPANGKEYRILPELPISRFKELDKMEVEFFYGVDMQTMFNKIKAAYNDLNSRDIKIADASVKLHNLMIGVAEKVDNRTHIVMRICSLFLVTEDEDINQWSEELAAKKEKDWQAEGYKMSSFFSLVASFLPGFLSAYDSVLKGTLDKVNKSDNKKKNQ
jgi:hypothetical protein